MIGENEYMIDENVRVWNPVYKWTVYITTDFRYQTQEDLSWWKRFIFRWVFGFKLEKIK